MRGLAAFLVCALSSPHASVFAEEISIPYVFSNGTVANADEVNANFSTLVDALNSTNQRSDISDQLASLNRALEDQSAKTNSLETSVARIVQLTGSDEFSGNHSVPTYAPIAASPGDIVSFQDPDNLNEAQDYKLYRFPFVEFDSGRLRAVNILLPLARLNASGQDGIFVSSGMQSYHSPSFDGFCSGSTLAVIRHPIVVSGYEGCINITESRSVRVLEREPALSSSEYTRASLNNVYIEHTFNATLFLGRGETAVFIPLALPAFLRDIEFERYDTDEDPFDVPGLRGDVASAVDSAALDHDAEAFIRAVDLFIDYISIE